MAKELPYFRFTVAEWLNDDISLESYELKGLFADVCAFYWFKDCTINLTTLEKKFSNAKNLLEQLISLDIIKLNDDNSIEILFLDNQYDFLSEKRKKRSEAGRKGGLSKSSNAKAMLKQRSSYKDKDKDKDKDNFSVFWDLYHKITGKSKSDKIPTEKHWNKLNKSEKEKAIDKIQDYYKSIKNKDYIKKARTYLSDKNFNDEFVIKKPEKKMVAIDSWADVDKKHNK